jgi:hypothetical protein
LAAWWRGWVLCCGGCVLVAMGSRGGGPQVLRSCCWWSKKRFCLVCSFSRLRGGLVVMDVVPAGLWSDRRSVGAGASGENLASASVGAGSGNTSGVAIPCWRRCCEAPAYPTVRSWVLRVKTQAPDPPERATATSPRRFLLGGVALDTRSLVTVETRTLLWFLLLWGRWTPGQRPWTVVVRRGGGLGIRCGQKLHGVEQLLASLG